jgi:GR25 family glycosyltransferase involved in LPS biosynthesis
MRRVQKAIADNEWEKRLPYILDAKQRLLTAHSFFPRLEGIIDAHNLKKVVVNLDRRPDRWAKFVQRADEARLTNYERFSAVDGQRDDDIDALRKMIAQDATPQMKCPGVLGCLGSHLKIWEQCVEDRRPVLVLEDDVTFTERFMDKLATVYADTQRISTGWDVVFVGYHHNTEVVQLTEDIAKVNELWPTRPIVNFFNLCLQYHIHHAPFGFVGGGTFGYLLSPRGAEKLRDHTYRTGLIMPVDYHIMCLSHIPVGGPGAAAYATGDVDVFITARQIVESVIFSEDTDIDIKPYVTPPQ